MAIIATAFSEYASVPFYPGCTPPEMVKKMLAISAIFLMTIINGVSSKLSARVQIFFTVAKLCLVFAIIVGGVVQLANGKTENFQNAMEATSTSASAWAIAIYNGINPRLFS